jgi:DNA polymerase/3'-5' exonuclease PolX
MTPDKRSYRACSIKRGRRTRAEIDDIKAAIVATLKGDHPMTVRQVFYRLVVQKVIEKTEKEYQNVVIADRNAPERQYSVRLDRR